MRVVTIASHTPTAAYYMFPEMLASVRKYGHEPLILSQGYAGLGTKLKMLKEALPTIHDEYIIFCDAFDILFQQDPALAVARAILDHAGKIVFNAEKNLFPENSNDTHPLLSSPWRYLNSGFAVGPTDLFRQCLNAVDPNDMRNDTMRWDRTWDTPNDQQTWQALYCSGKHPIALDSTCNICQALCGVTDDELDFSERLIRNTVTNTEPVAFHCNGSKEVWKDRLISKLGL